MKKVIKKNVPLLAAGLIFLFLAGYSFRQPEKEKKIIFSEKAPRPIGPYSQAIMAGNTLYVSGQAGTDEKGNADTSDIKAETRRTLTNISEILKAAGMSGKNVVKATVYLKDIRNFTAMNEVYAAYFEKDPPARETVEVKNLPKGMHVEISVIAVKL